MNRIEKTIKEEYKEDSLMKMIYKQNKLLKIYKSFYNSEYEYNYDNVISL